MTTADTFLRAIELTPGDADDTWLATPQPVPWPKAYGGDLVAQATAAAERTVTDDRVVHSMHSYFIRPVSIGVAVSYRVERLRDGRSFSSREVRGIQNGVIVFSAMLSFHTREAGSQYAQPLAGWMAGELADPESLPSSADTLWGVDTPAAHYWSAGRSFDQRHVPGPLYLDVDGARQPHQAVWVKAFSGLGEDAGIHRLALAYVCDYTILEPVLRQQGRSWSDRGLVTASLDHALWFHRDGRLDEWVLYAQRAVSAQDARGLALGSFYSRGGTLLATVAQEGLVRLG